MECKKMAKDGNLKGIKEYIKLNSYKGDKN